MTTYIQNLNEEIISCKACPRLVAWREQVGREKRRAFRDETYWAKPVPGFGDVQARVLILGLAPGAHGSNRTGRMFTGDDSGKFLYPALHEAGFANRPSATGFDDGLLLKDVFITAICRCVPPDNKPTPGEIRNCRHFLLAEIELLENLQGIVALGKLAYDAARQLTGAQKNSLPLPSFGHNVFFRDEGSYPWVLGSYHPSRQNTQTGRLTTAMFDQIWQRVRVELNK